MAGSVLSSVDGAASGDWTSSLLNGIFGVVSTVGGAVAGGLTASLTGGKPSTPGVSAPAPTPAAPVAAAAPAPPTPAKEGFLDKYGGELLLVAALVVGAVILRR